MAPTAGAKKRTQGANPSEGQYLRTSRFTPFFLKPTADNLLPQKEEIDRRKQPRQWVDEKRWCTVGGRWSEQHTVHTCSEVHAVLAETHSRHVAHKRLQVLEELLVCAEVDPVLVDPHGQHVNHLVRPSAKGGKASLAFGQWGQKKGRT